MDLRTTRLQTFYRCILPSVFVTDVLFWQRWRLIMTSTAASATLSTMSGSVNRNSQRPHTSAKENMVWIQIRTMDSDSGSRLLPKFNGDFLVQGYICHKIFMKIRSLFSDLWQKSPISQCWRILWKIPGSGSAGGWLPKFNQFFLVYRYICGKIFVKIRSVVFV